MNVIYITYVPWFIYVYMIIYCLLMIIIWNIYQRGLQVFAFSRDIQRQSGIFWVAAWSVGRNHEMQEDADGVWHRAFKIFKGMNEILFP